jgi:hypothetical protein
LAPIWVVLGLTRCSRWVMWAGTRHTMSYVRNITSWKMRLLC